MSEIGTFVANVMHGMEAVESVIASIREDAAAGIPMSPAQQLVVASMMESNVNLIRVLAEAVAQYQEAVQEQ